jgi:hypothetical protein
MHDQVHFESSCNILMFDNGESNSKQPKETFMNYLKGYYHYDELVIAHHFSYNSKHTIFLKDLVDTFILLWNVKNYLAYQIDWKHLMSLNLVH